MGYLAEQGKHAFTAVETRLDEHRARKVQRQLQASGYKAWFSRAKEPTAVGGSAARWGDDRGEE